MSTNGYTTLTRSDLRGFDDKAMEIILRATELGAKGRISAKGHAILRAPNGSTISVSRSLQRANRAWANTETAFRRAFPEAATEVVVELADDDEGTEDTEGTYEVPVIPKHPLVPGEGEPLLECPANGCEATFVTEGARYSHVEKEHYKCTEPGCGYAAVNESGRKSHYRIVHEGNHPRKGNGKAQKAEATLQQIRELLGGVDPAKVTALEEALAKADARIKELEGKLSKLKGLLE